MIDNGRYQGKYNESLKYTPWPEILSIFFIHVLLRDRIL